MSELRLQHCRLDNRYDLLDCLGRGSYAEVYVAHDVVAEANKAEPKTVVVKALNPQLQGEIDPDLERTLLENFRNEAYALDRVRHPNVISRLGHGTAIDLAGRTFHYIVLEYLPGGDLAVLCRRQPLTIERTLFYIEQVCAGLAHAHECGIIHRDIKPHNLLLTADREVVKITDFGVAKIKLIEAAEGAITRVGTDVYAAPEHHPLAEARAFITRPLDFIEPHLTPAADVYSLAKTTYMLLTGEAPRRFAQRSISEFPVPVAHETWAETVLEVLRHATQVDPARRYQSVGEYWLDLQRAVNARVQNLIVNTANGEDNYGSGFEGASEPLGAGTQTIFPNPAGHMPAVESTPAPANVVPLQGEQAHKRIERDRHGRIVVNVAVPEPAKPRQPQQQQQWSPPGGATLKANGRGGAFAPQPNLAPQTKQAKVRSSSPAVERLKRLMVVLLMLAIFAGMLYATVRYIRSTRTDSPTATATNSNANSTQSPIGREFIATTDIKLRSGAGVGNPQVGLVERDSRVRVRSVQDNWYEVVILDHGRAPNTPGFVDQGWINSQLVRER